MTRIRGMSTPNSTVCRSNATSRCSAARSSARVGVPIALVVPLRKAFRLRVGRSFSMHRGPYKCAHPRCAPLASYCSLAEYIAHLLDVHLIPSPENIDVDNRLVSCKTAKNAACVPRSSARGLRHDPNQVAADSSIVKQVDNSVAGPDQCSSPCSDQSFKLIGSIDGSHSRNRVENPTS